MDDYPIPGDNKEIRQLKKIVRVEKAKGVILDALNDTRVFREIEQKEVDGLEVAIEFLDEYKEREE